MNGADATAANAAGVTTSGQPVVLGGHPNDSSFALGGFIGEALVVPRAITDDEVRKLEGYLAFKWGLLSVLPAGHPYKSSPPRIGS